MTALLALQLRVLRRGLPFFLRFIWVFFIFPVAYALRSSRPDDELFSALAAAPLAMVFIGVFATMTAAEQLTWLVPLPRTARIWGRVRLLALTGIITTVALVSLLAICRIPPRVPWLQLAASLWTCWIAGGLLLTALSDLTERRHPVINGIGLMTGIAPGIAMSCVHLVEKMPVELLLGELVACGALLYLNVLINGRREMGKLEPVPSTGLVNAAQPDRRALDRVPDLTSVLPGGLLRYRLYWWIGIGWFVISLAPVLASQFIFSLLFLILAFQGVLNHWRPFQAVPLPRSRVFLMLTSPILVAWAFMLGVQGVSFHFLGQTGMLQEMPGSRTVGLIVPELKRNTDAELSPELRHGSPVPLPASPERTAALMSELYKVSYGLDVGAGDILSLRRGEDPRVWLEAVERRWSLAVSGRFIEWRMLLATLLLMLSLASMLTALPGRSPVWLYQSLMCSFALLPLAGLALSKFGRNALSNLLPSWFRSAYVLVFDRPGLLAAVFGLISAALFLRHLRVFSRDELVDPTRRT